MNLSSILDYSNLTITETLDYLTKRIQSSPQDLHLVLIQLSSFEDVNFHVEADILIDFR